MAMEAHMFVILLIYLLVGPTICQKYYTHASCLGQITKLS